MHLKLVNEDAQTQTQTQTQPVRLDKPQNIHNTSYNRIKVDVEHLGWGIKLQSGLLPARFSNNHLCS